MEESSSSQFCTKIQFINHRELGLSVVIIKTNLFMLFGEIITVCCGNHAIHCEQITEFLHITAGGTQLPFTCKKVGQDLTLLHGSNCPQEHMGINIPNIHNSMNIH
jgi:hypothetical protein